MKITIESTEKIVTIEGQQARIWQGHTESGIPVHCYINLVAVAQDDPRQEEFERELRLLRSFKGGIKKIT